MPMTHSGDVRESVDVAGELPGKCDGPDEGTDLDIADVCGFSEVGG